LPPTVEPSSQPSSQPSNFPSREPFSSPSCYPSNQPTVGPTVSPTSAPSLRRQLIVCVVAQVPYMNMSLYFSSIDDPVYITFLEGLTNSLNTESSNVNIALQGTTSLCGVALNESISVPGSNMNKKNLKTELLMISDIEKSHLSENSAIADFKLLQSPTFNLAFSYQQFDDGLVSNYVITHMMSLVEKIFNESNSVFSTNLLSIARVKNLTELLTPSNVQNFAEAKAVRLFIGDSYFVNAPTSFPTISKSPVSSSPTLFPTSSQPSSFPTSSRPSFRPSLSPTAAKGGESSPVNSSNRLMIIVVASSFSGLIIGYLYLHLLNKIIKFYVYLNCNLFICSFSRFVFMLQIS
jgi:hypothetical protein